MSQQDLTADMLTRIRNAVRNRVNSVKCIDNKLNRGICGVLQDEGYIKGFEITESLRGNILNVNLAYGKRGEQLIRQIDRVSKPGCRRYSRMKDLPRPLGGLGIAIVSTSKGVMSDRRCRQEMIGGEVVALVS